MPRIPRLLKIVSTAAGLLLLGACVYLKPAEIPMGGDYLHFDERNTTLVLLLHGRGGSPDNFSRYATVTQILDCNPRVNLYAPDSHFGYYRERIISERLRLDVIQPALDAGITRVWLLGVSLGGLGSLAYQMEYPEEVSGVILMAPYLGEWDELEAYVADPGGSRSDFVEIWRALEALARQAARAVATPTSGACPVYSPPAAHRATPPPIDVVD